jgi:dockerin type I repeat protein
VALAAMPAMPADSAMAEDLPELPLETTVTQYGITWTFDHAVPVGQFVNGDYYVVGPVTVTGIDPLPADGRNGSVLNLPTNAKAGFDDRQASGRYDASQFRAPPIALVPGDSLISSISVVELWTIPRMLRPSSTTFCPVETVAILTCMATQPPPDAFRPAYCDTANRIYRANDLRRHLLPSIERSHVMEGRPKDDVLWRVDPTQWDTSHIPTWVRVFQRPWIDTCYDGFVSPVRNMPQYGREVARASGHAALLLCCDYTAEEKEPLLVNFVQVGIDLWGAIRAGHGGWRAHGGHFNGRKLPIVLAGYLLGDTDMMNPYAQYPAVLFSEDQQTIYDAGWTGATAVFGGHYGEDGHPSYPDWGKYEHLHPRDWPGTTGESYRRCCTSLTFIGQALALKILHAENVWNHPAFFDYSDRWMTEDDTQHVAVILAETGQDYSASWARQRQCWDPFIEDMWATYRNNLPPAPGAAWEVLATHGGGVGELATAVGDGYVEPRAGGLRELRITFTEKIDPATATPGAVTLVGETAGDVSSLIQTLSLDASGRQLTVSLSASPPNADTVTVAVTDQLRTTSGATVVGDRDIVLGVLAGDVNSSGAVSAADILAVRGAVGQALSGATAGADANASGTVTGGDLLWVRSRLGSQLP